MIRWSRKEKPPEQRRAWDARTLLYVGRKHDGDAEMGQKSFSTSSTLYIFHACRTAQNFLRGPTSALLLRVRVRCKEGAVLCSGNSRSQKPCSNATFSRKPSPSPSSQTLPGHRVAVNQSGLSPAASVCRCIFFL